MSPNRDRIIELGGLKVRDHQVTDQFNCLVMYPDDNFISGEIISTQGIANEMIEPGGIDYKQALSDWIC